MKTEDVLLHEAEYRVVRESLGIYLVDLVIVPRAGSQVVPEGSPPARLHPEAEGPEDPGSTAPGDPSTGK